MSAQQNKAQQQEVKVAACLLPSTHIVPEINQLTAEPERDLVTRAKEGDDEAFAILFDRHKKRVYSLCLRMTGNIPEAEDLAQDAFIQVFRKLETFRGDSAFSTWLYRVVVNTVLMKLRKRSPRQVSLDEPVQMESSSVPRDVSCGDARLLGAVDRIALIRAIQKLPTGCRTIFLLHEVEGYEHNEIASMLHCSVGNSKSQLHKARLRIREILQARPHEASAAAVQQTHSAARSKVRTRTPAEARMEPEDEAADLFLVSSQSQILNARGEAAPSLGA
jgi:RNA polymerase sigma-70 factor, ECF subfamily